MRWPCREAVRRRRFAVGAAHACGDQVLGIDIDAEPERVRADVVRFALDAAALLGTRFNPACIEVVAGHAGPAYGVPHASTLDAIRLAGRLEALALDPVYSGKGLAGLIALIREGRGPRRGRDLCATRRRNGDLRIQLAMEKCMSIQHLAFPWTAAVGDARIVRPCCIPAENQHPNDTSARSHMNVSGPGHPTRERPPTRRGPPRARCRTARAGWPARRCPSPDGP